MCLKLVDVTAAAGGRTGLVKVCQLGGFVKGLWVVVWVPGCELVFLRVLAFRSSRLRRLVL